MYCSRFCALLVLLLSGNVIAAGNVYLLGAGVETDTEDSLSLTALAGVGLGEKTWLSGGVSTSSVDLPTGRGNDTTYANLGIDHHFDPLGVRVGASYWGDPDTLESRDWAAAIYYRNDKFTLAADYEFRDFDFTIPATNLFPGRAITFDADGIGASASLRLSDRASLGVGGMSYDYSVDFRPLENRDIVGLISATRLSLINSLIDSRAYLTVGIDRGLSRWEFDVATSKGAIDRSRTQSLTLRYLFPASDRADVELGVGYDDSDLYGSVTFLSLFVYFYGGS